jgi:hypothetical protein
VEKANSEESDSNFRLPAPRTGSTLILFRIIPDDGDDDEDRLRKRRVCCLCHVVYVCYSFLANGADVIYFD